MKNKTIDFKYISVFYGSFYEGKFLSICIDIRLVFVLFSPVVDALYTFNTSNEIGLKSLDHRLWSSISIKTSDRCKQIVKYHRLHSTRPHKSNRFFHQIQHSSIEIDYVIVQATFIRRDEWIPKIGLQRPATAVLLIQAMNFAIWNTSDFVIN